MGRQVAAPASRPAGRPLAGALAGAALVAAGSLAGCSGSTSGGVTAAPQATSAACVTALAAAPARVLGKPRSPLPVSGTAAWGEPAVVVRCGLPEQQPTTKQCLAVDDVDWVVDDSGDPLLFTAYGRAPTVQVRVPRSYGTPNATSVLVGLNAIARGLPRTSHACIG